MNYESSIKTMNDQTDGYGAEPADGNSGLLNRRVVVIVAVAALLLVGLWIFIHRKDAGSADGTTAGQAATVSVVTPGRVAIQGLINATGTLAARRELPVGSVGEGGRVVTVLVDAGDWVSQGQVLAVVDRSVQTQQQASQAAQIAVAAADARIAQSNLDRAQRLVDRGFISKAEIDRLGATRDAALARVNVARAALGQLRAEAAQLNIFAPADGLVMERKVEPGQVVGGGSGVLFRIAKGGELELQARLSETDLALVRPGFGAAVTPVGATRTFSGQIWQISPVIDPLTRQGVARVALAYAPELRPGGFASVVIRAGTVVAPKLPESAIMSDSKGSFVYVVGAGNKVERRPVKTGTVAADGIAVTEGIAGSERIILRAGAFLQPGETVNPRLAPTGAVPPPS